MSSFLGSLCYMFFSFLYNVPALDKLIHMDLKKCIKNIGILKKCVLGYLALADISLEKFRVEFSTEALLLHSVKFR